MAKITESYENVGAMLALSGALEAAYERALMATRDFVKLAGDCEDGLGVLRDSYRLSAQTMFAEVNKMRGSVDDVCGKLCKKAMELGDWMSRNVTLDDVVTATAAVDVPSASGAMASGVNVSAAAAQTGTVETANGSSPDTMLVATAQAFGIVNEGVSIAFAEQMKAVPTGIRERAVNCAKERMITESQMVTPDDIDALMKEVKALIEMNLLPLSDNGDDETGGGRSPHILSTAESDASPQTSHERPPAAVYAPREEVTGEDTDEWTDTEGGMQAHKQYVKRR